MAKITQIKAQAPAMPVKKKVAAYARVSLDSERLLNSLANQVSYYSSLIQKNPEWEYAGVFADEGITGTLISKRSEFQRMLKECEEGKIDIILTKSIQRFARNTVDLLETVRHLKEIGDRPDDLQTKVDEISGEMEALADKNKKLIEKNAKTAMDQAEYEKKYSRLVSRYVAKERELQEVAQTLAAARAKDEAVTAFVERLREMDSVSDEFDEDLWYGMGDTMTVHKDGSTAVRFKGGAEINVK